MDLLALFVAAFVSATILPGGSELGLALLVAESAHSLLLLVGLATLGNTLGGMTTYGIGRLIAHRFPAEERLKPRHAKAVERVRRWGVLALLLSWVPVIGDPICLAAGWLKTRLLPTLLLMATGKGLRYLVVAMFFN